MTTSFEPIAVGPLIGWHESAGATFKTIAGWQVAASYPNVTENRLVDCSHWAVAEYLADLASGLASRVGLLPGVGRFKQVGDHVAYQLTDQRAIVVGPTTAAPGIDVTGGWSAMVIDGPNSLDVLAHVTGLDLRASRFPIGGCKQGPVFGVSSLVARSGDRRYELHVCPDSFEFLWEAILDAGQAYDLRPAGIEQDQ
jgi:heterotetrameric sarcosine oxidase gamma subunit